VVAGGTGRAWADGAVPNFVMSGGGITPANWSGNPGAAPYRPQEIRRAYGLDNASGVSNVTFNHGTIMGDGSGQTIAIIDAYNAPNIVADLATFDAKFGLAAPPSFKVVNQSGGSTLPPVDTSGAHWDFESSIDVEWAHAMAPKANIVLVEASSIYNTDLYAAANYAGGMAGVSVVSMSWSGNEYPSEGSGDTTFKHPGVTYVAASGDYGAYSTPDANGHPVNSIAVQYPAASKNVVAVGGTTLNLTPAGDYSSETGWGHGTSSYLLASNGGGGSGGGTSVYEGKPSAQNELTTPSLTARCVPDVSMVADPSTGVYVCDSYLGGGNWYLGAGTSLAAPMFAGLLAVADQGRALNGLGLLDSSNTLPLLYGLSGADFHDITSGSNGYSAGLGYDLVTGRGSPVGNLMIGDLAVPEPGTLGLVAVGVVGLLRRRR